jgi:hypothetical protein
MEDKCSSKPSNLKDLIKSQWFKKPLLVLSVGSLLGLIIYGLFRSNPYANNIFGDMLAGVIIGLFFIKIPCLTCNYDKEQL